MSEIRILLAEDQTMFRSAVISLLSLEDDLVVVGETGRGDEVEALVRSLRPDVVLLDIEMPGADGLTVARQLQKLEFPVRTIIVTTFGRPGYLRAALEAGVSGLVLKDKPIASLAEAIRKVVAGQQAIDSEVALAALREGSSPLTDREREVLAAARNRSTIQELSKQLMLSAGTVRNYLSSAIQKLNAQNRAEAIDIADEKGWL
jgi:two-component system response regulator DesR